MDSGCFFIFCVLFIFLAVFINTCVGSVDELILLQNSIALGLALLVTSFTAVVAVLQSALGLSASSGSWLLFLA